MREPPFIVSFEPSNHPGGISLRSTADVSGPSKDALDGVTGSRRTVSCDAFLGSRSQDLGSLF